VKGKFMIPSPMLPIVLFVLLLLMFACLYLLNQVRQNLLSQGGEPSDELAAEKAAERAELDAKFALLQDDSTRVKHGLEGLEKRQQDAFQAAREAAELSAKLLREEVAQRQDAAQASLSEGLKTLGEGLQTRLKEAQEEIHRLSGSNDLRLVELRETLDKKLEALQKSNEGKLDAMREVVDEKLQSTIEKRLGESFKLVSEQLTDVSKGIGEMRGLASEVGDLKRVMGNVKSRGVIGEAQLAALLEQILTPDQYATNKNVTGRGQEQVEIAVKLPGQDPDSPLWLPIDSKFPVEDYQKLNDALESGEKEDVLLARKALIRVVKSQAKMIQSKYISPPLTTDFAILFLPSEGLFAEVLREPGLVEALLHDFHIVITGPTTLAALLSSLQMGFKTLALQKRSSEVWKVLGATRTEFAKYSDLMKKLSKKLGQAQDTITKTYTRSRVIERKLRDVESLDQGESQDLLGFDESLDADIAGDAANDASED
jgi:DNA recombination protein RmuC